MKGIESKSLPRGAVKVEQARPGAGWDGARGRFVGAVLTRLTPVPWKSRGCGTCPVADGRGCA